MDSHTSFAERRKYPRYSILLPLEYWQTDDACRGGVLVNLSEGDLLVHSIWDMAVGTELNVRIFFPNGYEFDGIRVTGKIVRKDLHYETDWKEYKYEIEFVRISGEDREKLVNLLSSPTILEEISIKENTQYGTLLPQKPTLPHQATLGPSQVKETGRRCLWDRFKTKVLHLR